MVKLLQNLEDVKEKIRHYLVCICTQKIFKNQRQLMNSIRFPKRQCHQYCYEVQ